jgi:hypothetical protein
MENPDGWGTSKMRKVRVWKRRILSTILILAIAIASFWFGTAFNRYQFEKTQLMQYYARLHYNISMLGWIWISWDEGGYSENDVSDTISRMSVYLSSIESILLLDRDFYDQNIKPEQYTDLSDDMQDLQTYCARLLDFFGTPSGGYYQSRRIEYVYEDGIFNQEEKEWIHKQFEIFEMLHNNLNELSTTWSIKNKTSAERQFKKALTEPFELAAEREAAK